MNKDALLLFEKEIKKVKIASCLIYENGEILFKYFKNKKMENKLFQLNSTTKSVISILIGIAIDKGLIKSVQTPIHEYFDIKDEDKRELTIEHLLTMTMGIEWGEFGPWGGRPFPMINSKDWIKFVLEKKMAKAPGAEMEYNSGASHLLSAIL